MKTFLKYALVISTALSLSCSDSKQSERLFTHFLNRHAERIKPINKRYNEAIWSTYSGQSSFSELYDKTRLTDSLLKIAGEPIDYYQGLLNNVYDNSSEFEMLLKIKQSGLLTDSLLKREFVNVFRNYIKIQNNWNESDKKKTELYEKFFELKKTESAFWDSLKQVSSGSGRKEWIERFASLTDEFRNMVVAMNKDTRQLGYQNYYQAVLDFNGVDYNSIDELCNIIENETNEDYRKLLAISQFHICKNYNIETSQIKLEHYNQSIKEMMIPQQWQKEYKNEEVVNLLKKFFALGNYEIDDVLQNSDLWYAEGKFNQSFFICTDLDEKDNRIYANIKPSTLGVYVLLHEMGHAVHYKYVDRKVPYLLKEPNQITTEAVGIYFNNKLYHSQTLREMMGIDDRESSVYYKAFSDPTTLIYLRKLIRNIQFEKGIFEDPTIDFNQLWWTLTQRYLFYDNVADVDRLPEWISNQHIVNASGIHVFYLYAYAFAAQLEAYFPDGNIADLKQGIMKYGDSMEWNELLKQATGEPLNLKYLFNSYKWKNKSDTPITFDVKMPEGLSFIEKRMYEDLIDGDLYAIAS